MTDIEWLPAAWAARLTARLATRATAWAAAKATESATESAWATAGIAAGKKIRLNEYGVKGYKVLVKKPIKVVLTMDEVAEKFGVPVGNLKIKQ